MLVSYGVLRRTVLERYIVPSLLNLAEYEQRARELLPHAVYDYYAGGSADEVTLRENITAWQALRLRPRMLVDVHAIDLQTSVLGQPITMPIITAPCAQNALAHPDGEYAVARATAALGTIQTLSTVSSYALEDIAAATTGSQWFQLYCFRDRNITRNLVERAEAAGYSALCVTVDVPLLGHRERDTRNAFALPPQARLANLAPFVPAAATGADVLNYIDDMRLTWDGIAWIRSITQLPIILKGILTAEDALLGVQHGAAAICVSNHGGRQLDSAITACAALPEIVAAIGTTAEIYADGGIRRGTDILKALALGALGRWWRGRGYPRARNTPRRITHRHGIMWLCHPWRYWAWLGGKGLSHGDISCQSSLHACIPYLSYFNKDLPY
jgi:4-hydroxymandelate oxidase